MDEIYSRSALSERILNDLRNIVKQVYHESVHCELSPENRNYVCVTLIKNLDEVLRHGLKQLHIGYWKAICEVLHPQALTAVEQLQTYDASKPNGLVKGRAWIAYSLKEDSLSSYIQCLINETCLEKYYEDWSILRINDTCNWFLSILSGLDNVLFTYDIEYLNKPPKNCNFGIKILSNKENKVIPLGLSGSKSSINVTSTSLTSPGDSGVHIQDSTFDIEQLLDDKQIDIDFLNGNVPETVLLRKHKKNTKRHVSFHEDIIYKSPEKCRKLKWDSENLRYSWGGEELDSSILKEADFKDIKAQSSKRNTPEKVLDINERGTPEGEETPSNAEILKQNNKSQKSVIVRRFLQSIKKQSKIKQLSNKYKHTEYSFKKIKIDINLVAKINEEIEKELENRPKALISKNEVILNPSMVKEMIRNQSIYKAYKTRDYLFIITNANVYLINKNLEIKRISFQNLIKIIVYPDSHLFYICESDEEFHIFITGDHELTNEILGRLEMSMRKNQYDPPQFFMMNHEDLSFVKRSLIENLAIGKKEELVYCGTVYLDRDHDLLSSVLPTTKRGFLMYRDLRDRGGWKPGDFCLKNGILYLFEEEENFPKLAINISTGCQSCNRTKNPDRPHTFQISLIEKEVEFYSEANNFYKDNFIKSKLLKSDTQRLFSSIRQKVNKLFTFGGPKENGCVLEFAAANENELVEWLQMIIQASCGDSCEEASKEDLVPGMLWLTTNSLIITNEFVSTQSKVEIVSRAKLSDVGTFKIGKSEKDYFTVIEFICMEASGCSGDWVLFMNSRKEVEKLKFSLQNFWKFNNKFPFDYLKEGKLTNRCRRSQNSIFDNCWIQLLQ